jgi:hypothetical protein
MADNLSDVMRARLEKWRKSMAPVPIVKIVNEDRKREQDLINKKQQDELNRMQYD